MTKFSQDTYCSFCYMPGAKHEGGAEIEGQSVTGIFCNKGCFEKWVQWKYALLASNHGRIE